MFADYRRSGDRLKRDALIETYLKLARSLARRYRRGGEPLEDVEQVACLALVKAVEGFDPSRGTAFSSFAVPTITGALKRHFRDCGWSVRVPRDLQELALRVQRIHDDISAATGAVPTAAAIAKQAGVSVEDVLEAREAYRALHADSLDRPRPAGEDDGRASLLDTLGDGDGELGRVCDRVALESLIATLEHRDQALLRLYYLDGLTQSRVGARLGYSQMHISRLLRRATVQLQLAAARHSRIGGRSPA